MAQLAALAAAAAPGTPGHAPPGPYGSGCAASLRCLKLGPPADRERFSEAAGAALATGVGAWSAGKPCYPGLSERCWAAWKHHKRHQQRLLLLTLPAPAAPLPPAVAAIKAAVEALPCLEAVELTGLSDAAAGALLAAWQAALQLRGREGCVVAAEGGALRLAREGE